VATQREVRFEAFRQHLLVLLGDPACFEFQFGHARCDVREHRAHQKLQRRTAFRGDRRRVFAEQPMPVGGQRCEDGQVELPGAGADQVTGGRATIRCSPSAGANARRRDQM
jgi:hypothetical protein